MSQSFVTQEIEVIAPVSKPEVDYDSKVVVKKPKIDKPRKVINMHYKPALSNKQKEKLHSQPFKGTIITFVTIYHHYYTHFISN
jgi:hypothetical protein